MVKISGGGRCIGAVKAHIDYISRKGKVECEDERGIIYVENSAIKAIKKHWQDGGYAIPAEVGARAAFNIVLSMPPGTSILALKDAQNPRRFALEQFSKHYYVFAAHEDERHPHVHLCVKAVDCYGKRLNPRKADLQNWRESFARAFKG